MAHGEKRLTETSSSPKVGIVSVVSRTREGVGGGGGGTTPWCTKYFSHCYTVEPESYESQNYSYPNTVCLRFRCIDLKQLLLTAYILTRFWVFLFMFGDQ